MKPNTPDFWKDAYKVRYESRLKPVQTAIEVNFLDRLLARAHVKTVLDFACGYGRHAIPLAGRGYPVHGYDGDEASINRARLAAKKLTRKNRPQFDRRDLASEPVTEQYDAGLCLYSSIGFLTEEQNAAMLANFLNAVKRGGLAVLDLQSAAWTREQQPLSEERTLVHDGRPYCIKHERHCESAPLREINRLTFDPPLNGVAEHGYELRIYDRPELEAILKRHGFAVVSVYGSFHGDKPSPLLQREITVARRLSVASPQQNI